MPRTKQQHYVPQFYLRKFAVNGERLFAYDKVDGRSFPVAPRDAAGEQLFYEIPGLREAVPVDQFVEKFFHPIEGATSTILTELLDKLSSGLFSSLDRDTREILALHIAIQVLRTKEARTQTVEMFEKMGEAHFRAHLESVRPDMANADFSLTVDEGVHTAIHASLFLDPRVHQELASILLGHYWVIIRACPNTVFYTSDHPIAKQPHLSHPVMSMAGIGSPGIELAFPLSPQFILVLMDRQVFAAHAPDDGKLLGTAERANMDYYNSLQVREAYRFVYNSADDFALAARYCDKYPRQRDPERPRIQVDGGPWPAMRSDAQGPEVPHLSGQ